MLRARPEVEAQVIMARIRTRADASPILRQIWEGDILVQLALVSETRYRYEFPFIKEMPVDLQRVNNAYLNSLVYEWTLTGAGSPFRLPPVVLRNARWADLRPYHVMRKLVAAYFMYGSQLFICFQKDYFLEDMSLLDPELLSGGRETIRALEPAASGIPVSR